jgi:transposase
MPKALGCRETSAELRELICQKAATGTPLSQITFFFNRPLRTIQSIVKRSTERGDYENAPRSGRPPKLTDRALRRLSLSVTHDHRQTLRDITDSINTDIPAPVCARTVHTALKTRLGISSRIAAKKPFITAAQREKRLEWARDHVNWTMEDWKTVIWTDESSVEIGKESRTCTVWRREGEHYREECLVPTFKSGRKSIMVWGCISYGKRGPLVRMPSERRKGEDYVDLILAGPLWDYYVERFDAVGAALVMEDGAPVHCAKVAQRFRVCNFMERIPHPPQSPDLNPIEHVWKRLKVLVNRRPTRPRNAEELSLGAGFNTIAYSILKVF